MKNIMYPWSMIFWTNADDFKVSLQNKLFSLVLPRAEILPLLFSEISHFSSLSAPVVAGFVCFFDVFWKLMGSVKRLKRTRKGGRGHSDTVSSTPDVFLVAFVSFCLMLVGSLQALRDWFSSSKFDARSSDK